MKTRTSYKFTKDSCEYSIDMPNKNKNKFTENDWINYSFIKRYNNIANRQVILAFALGLLTLFFGCLSILIAIMGAKHLLVSSVESIFLIIFGCLSLIFAVLGFIGLSYLAKNQVIKELKELEVDYLMSRPGLEQYIQFEELRKYKARLLRK